MDLDALLRDPGASPSAVADALDGLDHDARVGTVFALDRDGQRRLYDLAAGAGAITLEHFVPSGRGARLAVRHHGRNTLPLPRRHRYFEKRFCRPDDGSARLFGYNESPSRGLIGPGYFVAVPTAGRDDWTPRGAVVVDYFQVPDGPVVDGWPAVVPNSHGLQWFVYRNTRDFMRRVSAHVSIGAAYKSERSLDHYFVLCREP